MTMRTENPWLVENVEPVVVGRLAQQHVPNARAVELDVDIVSDPHREDDEGHNWTLLGDARDVPAVRPGSAVLMGSSIGRYLAKVVAWDFEVSDDNPIVKLELLPVRPNEVERLLSRHRTSAA